MHASCSSEEGKRALRTVQAAKWRKQQRKPVKPLLAGLLSQVTGSADWDGPESDSQRRGLFFSLFAGDDRPSIQSRTAGKGPLPCSIPPLHHLTHVHASPPGTASSVSMPTCLSRMLSLNATLISHGAAGILRADRSEDESD